MKNKLLCLLLVMCLMFPAALFLTACGPKEDEEDETPAPPTALEILNTANTNLGTILEDATVSIVPTAQITAGVMKIYGGEDCTIVFKKDEGKTAINIPGELAENDVELMIDGKGNYYGLVDGNEDWSVNVTEGDSVYKYIEDLTELDILVDKISDIAHFYQATPLKLETKDNSRYLSLDLDLGSRVNNALILNYKNNHDKPISYFINTLLSDLSQKDINIVELVDDFAIGMNEDTTALEFVEFFAEALGVDVDIVVDLLNAYINYGNHMTGMELDTDLMNEGDSTSDDRLYTGYYENVAPLDVTELDGIALLPLIREGLEDNSVTGADISQIFEQYVEDPDYAITLDEALAQNPDMEEFVNYIENTTINMLGLNVKITLDENNKPTKLLFTLTGDGMFKEDDSTYVPMNINATLDCSFSKIGETTVSLPRTNTEYVDYHFDIVLDEEVFNWDDTTKLYTVKVDSSLIPESFNIVVEGETIARFNQITKNLQIDLIKIRDIVADYYGDTTYYEPNVYELRDSTYMYYITVRVA